MKVRNHYTCTLCRTEWYDDWFHTCNDECPICHTEIEPNESEELPEPEVYCCMECGKNFDKPVEKCSECNSTEIEKIEYNY